MEVLDEQQTAVEGSVKIDKNKAIYVFKATNKDDLGQKVNEYLKKQGYSLEAGVNTNGTYGKGNKVLRVLLGAFVKRFEWHVEVSDINNSTGLTFTKKAKGYSGGLIGMNQVKNEYNRLTGTLKAFHADHNGK